MNMLALVKTILLVEDDVAFGYCATKAMEAAGFTVILSSSSLAALRELEGPGGIDLLLADVKMPPGQPHGIALGLIARNRRADLPIVLMTSFAEYARQASAEVFGRVMLKSEGMDAIVAEVAARLPRFGRA